MSNQQTFTAAQLAWMDWGQLMKEFYHALPNKDDTYSFLKALVAAKHLHQDPEAIAILHQLDQTRITLNKLGTETTDDFRYIAHMIKNWIYAKATCIEVQQYQETEVQRQKLRLVNECLSLCSAIEAKLKEKSESSGDAN